MCLPFDVWLHITSFLPASQLRNLYAVNHALFDIAMDERYREIFINHRPGTLYTVNHALFDSAMGERYKEISLNHRPGIMRNLELLKDLNIARRVRTLHLWPHMGDVKSATSTIFKAMLWKRIQRSIASRTRAVIREKATKTMLQVIPWMSNLKEFHLHWHTWGRLGFPDLRFRSVVLAGWRAFGATLRSLTLAVSLEGWCHVLPPSMVFPALEELALTLFVAYLTTDTSKIVQDLVVPFVNNHWPTLQSFELTSRDHDVSAFFHGICHLPHLRKLHFSLPFSTTRHANASGIQRVLELHSTKLQDLAMGFEQPDYLTRLASPIEWQTFRFLKVALPLLNVLNTNLEKYLPLSGMIHYLKQFNSLTSLVLHDKKLSYEEVETLVSGVGGGLAMLAIEVKYISPELFDLMATNLPSLGRLGLLFDGMSSEFSAFAGKEFSLDVVESFCAMMRKRLYTNWKLRHFTIHPRSMDHWTEHWEDCEAAIWVALPCLQSLNVGWPC